MENSDSPPYEHARKPNSDFGTIAKHITLSRSADSPSRSGFPGQAIPETQAEADRCIQQGIQLHEAMNLTASTGQFARAAALGSSTGMYLYGMALRSGWGVERDEVTAFQYLSKAADAAMRQTSLSLDPSEMATSFPAAAARELTLAIYELGQSFLNGWGVKKCRKTGAFYLQIAANLGDPDAQADLATCYFNGDGVKRNKLTAARYYRLASNAGNDLPGNSWIWKPKYDASGVLKKASNHSQP
jgi:TPR repeat protein